MSLNESIVEYSALPWLEGLGFAVKHSPDIAPDELLMKDAGYTMEAVG